MGPEVKATPESFFELDHLQPISLFAWLLPPAVSYSSSESELIVPRASRILFIDASPPKDNPSAHCEDVKQRFHTTDDRLHVLEQAIDDFQGLRCSHPQFFLSQSV